MAVSILAYLFRAAAELQDPGCFLICCPDSLRKTRAPVRCAPFAMQLLSGEISGAEHNFRERTEPGATEEAGGGGRDGRGIKRPGVMASRWPPEVARIRKRRWEAGSAKVTVTALRKNRGAFLRLCLFRFPPPACGAREREGKLFLFGALFFLRRPPVLSNGILRRPSTGKVQPKESSFTCRLFLKKKQKANAELRNNMEQSRLCSSSEQLQQLIIIIIIIICRQRSRARLPSGCERLTGGFFRSKVSVAASSPLPFPCLEVRAAPSLASDQERLPNVGRQAVFEGWICFLSQPNESASLKIGFSRSA